MTPDSNLANGFRERREDAEPKWTVMVFMGAETFEGTEPLDDAAKADLEEIRFVGGATTLDVFVQIHRASEATRYRFGVDENEKPKAAERVIPRGQPEQALIGFIEESVKDSGHRREDYSMLVLWGHAYDFAFGRSRTREGVVDSIDFIDLSCLLERLQERIKALYQEKYKDNRDLLPTLDIIGFDACDIATVEIACQLQPFAEYLLGSEIGIPIPGWPYDRILGRLRAPKDRLMTPPEFGSYVVRRFCESYPASSPVSLTFLGLAHANELRARAEILALALTDAIGDSEKRHRIMQLFTLSQTGEDRPYVDVADLCLNLVRHSGDSLVAEAARALGDLLLSPQPPLVGNSKTGQGRPLIVDHGRNAGELARLNGISLYAPHVASGNDFGAVRGLYDGFVFARDTFWSRLVHALAEPS